MAWNPRLSLLIIAVAAVGLQLVPPGFATYCPVSNMSFKYPQQIQPNQSFTTSVTISGVCAPDDAYYYSIRSDLNSQNGLVLSQQSTPIGYSQGQHWDITVQNQITAPTTSGSWPIIYAVYIFADVGGGFTIDSISYKPITILVG